MTFVTQITLDALARWGTPAHRDYVRTLRDACAQHPPPFGTARYREACRKRAREPEWMTQSLISSISSKGGEAVGLWHLAGRTPDPDIAELIRQHAIDKARHARFHLAILDLTFPDWVDPDLRDDLRGHAPGYGEHDQPPKAATPASEDEVLDQIIRVNIGEIRAHIHQVLLHPAITDYCPPCHHSRLDRLLQSLLKDGTRHIDYTARLIDRRSNAAMAHSCAGRCSGD